VPPRERQSLKHSHGEPTNGERMVVSTAPALAPLFRAGNSIPARNNGVAALEIKFSADLDRASLVDLLLRNDSKI